MIRNKGIRERTGAKDMKRSGNETETELCGSPNQKQQRGKVGNKATVWVPYAGRRKRGRPAIRWIRDVEQR